jgi:Glycosyl hydrolases family 43/Ricin-type beta-trefoil lectin domain-like
MANKARYVMVAVAVAIATTMSAIPAQAATGSFTPGAARTDQNGNTLQLHGLGIIKVGTTWFGFGEDKTGESSSNAAFQDIPCYSSTDLAHWTLQSQALTRQASGDLGPNRVVERPKVIFNASTGQYVMYLHIDNSAYGEAKVGVATSATPCGPYSYRGSFAPLGFQSRDIGLFQDTDGTGYLLTEDRVNGLRIDRLSADYLSVTSAVTVFPDLEAPALVKIGGTYYIFGSHLTGWSTNDNVYATSTSLASGWSAFTNFAPVGTNTYNTQTANIIPVQGTAGTTYIYAGDRWTTANLGTSPLVWLPLTIHAGTVSLGWFNGWTVDTATGTWQATASNPGTGTHVLTAGGSGQAMDVAGGSTVAGALVVQEPKSGATSQQWTAQPVSGNVFTLHNVKSGLCLDVPNSATASGQQLEQWTCNGGANQQWAFAAVGNYQSASNASYTLVSLNSGKTVEVEGQSTVAGASIDQWPGNGGSNQTWSVS